MENRPNRIIWHHTAFQPNEPQFDRVNEWHKLRNFTLSSLGFYVGYHILIEKDGTVRRAREDNEIGCHTFGQNIDSLGICLAGNFDVEIPTKEQQIAFERQLRTWTEQYKIDKMEIYPHRHFRATTCPGHKLYDAWAQDILNDPLPEDNALLNSFDCRQ